MKKMTIHSEIAYLLAIVFIAFAIALDTASGLGISVVSSVAYIISQIVPKLTFGQAEYIVQGTFFIVFCIVMKRFRISFLSSFITGILYGLMLDLFMKVIPHFNPEITPVGSLPLYLNIIYFVLGMVLLAFSVALFYKAYFYPQIYDFFVRGICGKYHLNMTIFILIRDLCFLITSITLSLIFFHKLVGIGVGTFIMAGLNGFIIKFFTMIFDKTIEFKPIFKKWEAFFVREETNELK